MASYLCVKMNSSATKSYNIKSSANKPYLRVDTGFIPLTTATATGPKLMVRAGGVNYRLADFITTTTAITTGTSYLTSAKTTSTSYVTGSRASTSGTGYQTRMSTSATTYYTRMSTSATTYATRASTSKTDYAYKTNTTNTIYSGSFWVVGTTSGVYKSSYSHTLLVQSTTGNTFTETRSVSTSNSLYGLFYDTSMQYNESRTYTARIQITTTTRYTYRTRTSSNSCSITTSSHRKAQNILCNIFGAGSIYFTINGTSSSDAIAFRNNRYGDDNLQTFRIVEGKYLQSSSIQGSAATIKNTNEINLYQFYFGDYGGISTSTIYKTTINDVQNINIDLQIKCSRSPEYYLKQLITRWSGPNFEHQAHSAYITQSVGRYTSTALNRNVSRSVSYTHINNYLKRYSDYIISGVKSESISTSEQIFNFKNFSLTNISNNFYSVAGSPLTFHGLYSTATVAWNYTTYPEYNTHNWGTATCAKVVSSMIYNCADVMYDLTAYSNSHTRTSYQTNRSATKTVYLTRSSTSNTGYKTRSSTSATSYLTRSSTSNTTYATRSSQYTSNTSYLTQSETYQTSYITASTETTMEG